MYLIRRDLCSLNTAKSLFPLWTEETRKAALWFQDVRPRFLQYLTTICICFLQQVNDDTLCPLIIHPPTSVHVIYYEMTTSLSEESGGYDS